MHGNYDSMIQGIVNEYLMANYNLDIQSLDEAIRNILTNYNKYYETVIDDIDFIFSDSIVSNTVKLVADEINYSEEYNFKNMNFKTGDKVIDIGGNIGIVSIYLAKKFPFLKIYAYEPVHQNYENFLHNIKLNNIPEGTITVENMAVTSDGRYVNMSINALNTGGSSISDVISIGSVSHDIDNNIKSTTLEEICKTHGIDKISLLKIDCEGSEYEILKNADIKLLSNIESIRGEFHENKTITNLYDVDDLYDYISKYIKDIRIVKARGCFIM